MSVRISTCVDCATTIIGERPRCPACHQQYAVSVGAVSLGDEDVTVPRPRRADGAVPGLVRWMVVIELFVIITLGLIFAVKGCAS